MALDGLASVQSRISAIQERIESLSNGGRPPVSVTESGSSSSTSSTNTVSDANGTFTAEMAQQVANANLNSTQPASAVGKLQGVPGTAEAFVEKVRSYIGVPYVWGGTDPSKGLDCSGLVQTSAKQVGVTLPRVTYDQKNAGIEIPSIDQAKPGDLLITNNSHHVVVYIGDGKVIHAPRPGKNVTEATVESVGPIVTIRRVMRSADDALEVSSTPTANTVNTAKVANLAQNGALAALLGNQNTVGSLGSATGQSDLATALVGALSGTATAGTLNSANSSSLLGVVGNSGGYSATLLSQFANGSAPSSQSGADTGLASLLSGVDSNNMNSTASALNSVSTLRSALGV